MTFETELSELISSIGLPAPIVGELREEAWPKILSAFKKLIAIAQAAQSLMSEDDASDAMSQFNCLHILADRLAELK